MPEIKRLQYLIVIIERDVKDLLMSVLLLTESQCLGS